jgi:DNA-binding CsgD family transcriptional regulator
MSLVERAPQPTATQIKIVALAAQGLTTERVAQLLHLSKWTVKEYQDDLRKLLGATNIAHAVALCIVAGHLRVDHENHCVSAVELELVA